MIKKIKFIISIFFLLTQFFQVGCLSIWSERCSKNELIVKKTMIRNNNMAIRAVQLDNGGAGIGVDVSNLEALKYHPIRQISAAVGDMATMRMAYEGVRSFDNHNSITIFGNGNTVNINTYNTETK